MNIGKVIKFRRRELNLTQENVCRGICSVTYLSKLENNKIKVSKDILNLLCNRLNLSVNEVDKDRLEINMEELREIYKAISNGEVDKAGEKINQSLSLNREIDPTISCGFEILRFEFYTFKRDKDTALKLRDDLLKNISFFNDELKVWFLKSLGLFEYLFGDLTKSSFYLYKARNLLNNIKNIEAHLEYLLGLVNTRLLLLQKSMYHLEFALEKYNHEINFKKVIDCKLLLAVNHSKTGSYKIAEELFLNIERSLEKSNSSDQLGTVYHNLGYIYSLNTNHQKALIYYRKAIQVKTNLTDKLNTIYLLAYEYKKVGNKVESLNICNKVISQFTGKNNEFYYKILILKQSLLDAFQDDKFIGLLKNDIIPFFIKRNRTIASECYFLLGKIMENKNHYKKSTIFFKKAVELNYKISRREILI